MQVLPVKIADANGSLIAAYEGIKYASDHGCHIINCSWAVAVLIPVWTRYRTYHATINKKLFGSLCGKITMLMEIFSVATNYVLSVGNTTAIDTKSIIKLWLYG